MAKLTGEEERAWFAYMDDPAKDWWIEDMSSFVVGEDAHEYFGTFRCRGEPARPLHDVIEEWKATPLARVVVYVPRHMAEHWGRVFEHMVRMGPTMAKNSGGLE